MSASQLQYFHLFNYLSFDAICKFKILPILFLFHLLMTNTGTITVMIIQQFNAKFKDSIVILRIFLNKFTSLYVFKELTIFVNFNKMSEQI